MRNTLRPVLEPGLGTCLELRRVERRGLLAPEELRANRCSSVDEMNAFARWRDVEGLRGRGRARANLKRPSMTQE